MWSRVVAGALTLSLIVGAMWFSGRDDDATAIRPIVVSPQADEPRDEPSTPREPRPTGGVAQDDPGDTEGTPERAPNTGDDDRNDDRDDDDDDDHEEDDDDDDDDD